MRRARTTTSRSSGSAPARVTARSTRAWRAARGRRLCAKRRPAARRRRTTRATRATLRGTGSSSGALLRGAAHGRDGGELCAPAPRTRASARALRLRLAPAYRAAPAYATHPLTHSLATWSAQPKEEFAPREPGRIVKRGRRRVQARAAGVPAAAAAEPHGHRCGRREALAIRPRRAGVVKLKVKDNASGERSSGLAGARCVCCRRRAGAARTRAGA